MIAKGTGGEVCADTSVTIGVPAARFTYPLARRFPFSIRPYSTMVPHIPHGRRRIRVLRRSRPERPR